MSLWRWADRLAPVPEAARLSLGEGDTPLVKSRHLGPAAGLQNLYFKLEQGNPTGSYKDRFAFTAVSHMIAEGKTRCVATSSGNAGASLAAYCAVAGIECRIVLAAETPQGKLSQMLTYGARVVRVRGFGTDEAVNKQVFRKLKHLGNQRASALQVSSFALCPKGMSGVQTLAFELAEQLPQGIDHVFCPAGGGGLCVAAARGFALLKSQGLLSTLPRVECVQPNGNDTMVSPLREGALRARGVTSTTLISGLQVGRVLDGHLAVEACRASGGTGHLVSDETVWDVQRELARREGIFTEPAGAVALAGALQAVQRGEIQTDATIVCIVTGSGFKDPAAIDRMNQDIECPMVEASTLDSWS